MKGNGERLLATGKKLPLDFDVAPFLVDLSKPNFAKILRTPGRKGP
jgi:hypothetical protein